MLEDFESAIFVSRDFEQRFPGVSKDDFRESILDGFWPLPRLGSSHYIKGMGTTQHRVLPTSITVRGSGEPIDVLAKPFDEVYSAENEFTNTELARRRGVNVPPMIALIVGSEYSLVLSQLIHNTEALSQRRLDFKLSDPRIYTPRDFLEDFVGSIGEMHELGVVHGDIHIGNVGLQYLEQSPPQVIFFDFETSTVLDQYDLGYRGGDMYIPEERRARIELFENQAVTDLATFAANLWCNDFPMRKRCLLTDVAEVYQQKRGTSSLMLRGKRFYTQLAKEYDKAVRSLGCNRNS